MKKFALLSCLTLSMCMFNNCARNPVTGKRQVVFMSEAQELAMGKEADPQIIAQYGLYDDKSLQTFINEKGKAMAAISHRPNIDYNYRVIDSDVLNAFAVPGGYVYFTRGIMAHFNDEAQFAGVLGHETGHITARHSIAQQRNQLLGQLGIIAGVVLAPNLAQFAETASQGLGLLFLKFGRDDERQADELGVEYSSKIGYDAKEMALFFETLARQGSKSGQEIPEFLSTHPDPGNREITVAKLAAEWQAKLKLTNPVINRNSYLKRIEGLVYGEDPRQGYLENNIFYHPVLKFQFPVPQGWNYQNTPQRVQMAPKDGKALMFMTLAPGKTIQEAANATLKGYNLSVVESREITVNGLRAIAVVADPAAVQNQQGQQQQQPQQIRTLSYFIAYGDAIYHLMGISSAAEFNNYISSFRNTMDNFRELKDQAKLNKKPERIRIKTINNPVTLDQALRNYKMATARFDELAILNGMQLTDKLPQGIMIKIIAE